MGAMASACRQARDRSRGSILGGVAHPCRKNRPVAPMPAAPALRSAPRRVRQAVTIRAFADVLVAERFGALAHRIDEWLIGLLRRVIGRALGLLVFTRLPHFRFRFHL